MPASRDCFLRPLLALDRAAVLRYLAEKNIPWREDSTNTDTRFLRNRIRHRLIPLLNESFPRWRRGLSVLAETQSLAAAFISGEAGRRVCWTACPGGSLYTDAGIFFAQPLIIREEALFQGIDHLPVSRDRGSENPASMKNPGTSANLQSGGASSLDRKSIVPAGAMPRSRILEAPAPDDKFCRSRLRGMDPRLPIRRSALRRFCEGRVNAADLGLLRVSRNGGHVQLSPEKDRAAEQGFALLIKEPGLYTLKKAAVEARSCFNYGENAGGGEGFFALLPLVLRFACKGDCLVRNGRKITPRDLAKGPERGRLLSAVDRLGTAAFIGPKGLLLRRESPPDAGSEGLCMITVKRSNNSTGGMDVQQSK
jgi:tRNA(Ile)-lysidine synthase